jgi:RNA recognition motif-containing protein
MCPGFAFVSYADRDSAEKAVARLNGFGYDNLILHVEFAKPREEGEKKPSPESRGAGGGNKNWTMQGTR